MNFTEIAQARQSCRCYDPDRPIEEEKLAAILESARLAPSACNAQPYRITVCRGQAARDAADCVTGMGMNKFALQAPVLLVISEAAYSASAALGSKLKNNDYRSLDIGIVSAFITAEATAQGLGSCILGWFDDARLRKLCALDAPVRLVVTLGYAAEGDALRAKKRKDAAELFRELK